MRLLLNNCNCSRSRHGCAYMSALLQPKPLMNDGLLSRMHTQSPLPQHLKRKSQSTSAKAATPGDRTPRQLKKKAGPASATSDRRRVLHMARTIAPPLDHSNEFFPARPHTIRIRQEKQRAVHRSIGICQPQPIAACRSAREFALLILPPTDR